MHYQCYSGSIESNMPLNRLGLTIAIAFLFNSSSNGDRSFMAYMDNELIRKQTMMPNVRESLDDCHMRYHKHSVGESSYPIYERPHLKVRELPHLALIGWTGTDGAVQWNCIGTLVWENFVLTSAQCASNESSVSPDVTRFGNSDEIQQIKIAEAIRHPEYREGSRQHDVALLRLESKVELSSTVVPACLWNKEEINFHLMDAVVRNSTGGSEYFKGQVSPKPDDCVESSDLCVETIEAGSCLSDGFLQVALRHNAKESPFVVAIGSPSNTSCQRSASTRYTKVSSYVQWIATTIQGSGESAWEWKFQEPECALRYVHLRQYGKEVLMQQTNSLDVVTPERRRIEPKYTDAMVEINFKGYFVGQEECYGLIIDEDTVLTLAQCTTRYGKRATYVMYLNNERNSVINHYNHPAYREDQHHNNIGLLKVKTRFVFFESFVPFCIWHGGDLPDNVIELTGHGRRDLNRFSLHNVSVDVFEPQTFQLIARTDVLPRDNCSYPEEFSKTLPSGLTDEHLCFGNEPYLVPQTCQQAFGGPVGGKVNKFNKLFRYAYALNSFGRDCGFGRAAVGVRLSAHVEWLRSILLPDYRKDSGSLHFINSDLVENDTCRHVDGSEGLCIDAARCPKIRYDFFTHRQVVFCQSPTFVCCPYGNMLNETSAADRELDDCEDRYRMNRARANERLFKTGPVEEEFPHLVVIEWQKDGSARWSCRGTLITSKAVLTSGDCVQQESSAPSHVRLGMSEAAPVINVEEVVVHPKFDSDSGKNNIAVIKLKESIDPSSTVKYPACLWTNQTHTPFETIQLVINETTDTYVYPTAMYNTDCASLEEDVDSNQLCVDVQPPDTVVSTGDPLFWSKIMDDGSRVQYLVGIASYTATNDQSVNIHSRISSYIGWIKSVL